MPALRNIHVASWIDAVGKPTAATFVILFSLVGFTRSLLITVIPLNAHAWLGSAQMVSVLFFAVSLVGVVASLGVPWLVHRIRRRNVFALGIALTLLACGLMATGGGGGIVTGMLANVLAIAALEISLNLYIMDHIPRRELALFEPRRVFFAAGMWTLGPWLGVWLHVHVDPTTPFAVTAAMALATMLYFQYLRLTDHPAVAPAKKPPPNPLKYLPRFFNQPRLRLAWGLAIGRSAWWSMYFVYAPIYVVNSGMGEIWAGAIISLGTASFFLVPLWNRLGRRYGLRVLLIGGYLATGGFTLTVALLDGQAGVVALVMGAIAAGVIDAAGNVPFLRAVHPHERPEMTTVYNTFRGVSQTAPPGVFAILLKAFELPAVFFVGGAAMAGLAWFCKYLPRRL
ncbi:MAG: MFS transporter [Alphaproteobacteria bacterium]|nr:MFS transporter [Alphaproteobacteria bacterium]